MSGKVNSAIIGAAAEHYVMCQLLRQNMIAALAPRGVPDTDIIVSDRIGSTLAAIQVKGRSFSKDGGWSMKAKHETVIRALLFYCFVDFGKSLTDVPRCWIIPSKDVAKALTKSHRAWLDKPGRNGRPHQDTDMRRLVHDYGHETLAQYRLGWLDQYLEKWDLISQPIQTI